MNKTVIALPNGERRVLDTNGHDPIRIGDLVLCMCGCNGTGIVLRELTQPYLGDCYKVKRPDGKQDILAVRDCAKLIFA